MVDDVRKIGNVDENELEEWIKDKKYNLRKKNIRGNGNTSVEVGRLKGSRIHSRVGQGRKQQNIIHEVGFKQSWTVEFGA